MNAEQLLREVEALGVVFSLAPRGDRLKVDAPVGALDEGLRTQLTAHKAELLRLVSDREFACYQADVRARASEYQRARGGTVEQAETEVLFQLGGFDRWRVSREGKRAA